MKTMIPLKKTPFTGINNTSLILFSWPWIMIVIYYQRSPCLYLIVSTTLNAIDNASFPWRYAKWGCWVSPQHGYCETGIYQLSRNASHCCFCSFTMVPARSVFCHHKKVPWMNMSFTKPGSRFWNNVLCFTIELDYCLKWSSPAGHFKGGE